MIDTDGYRMNVGIILANDAGQLLWAKRLRQKAWQFPQGGIKAHETPKRAMYRELYEEIGLNSKQVEILGTTHGWLRYRLPHHLIRHHQRPLCIGQKQVWYMLKLLTDDSAIRFDAFDQPEFDKWQWVDYWQPAKEIVYFKKNVYKQALNELYDLVPHRNKNSKKIKRKLTYKLVEAA